MPKITAIVHTLNEEKNLRNCLESLKWADEILVIDMHSTDRTVEIAREYTGQVFFHENVGYVEPARKFALSKASNEWVLIVDADEMIQKKLRNHLLEYIIPNDFDAVWIPRKNYLFGTLMMGGLNGPTQDFQLRFFKKSRVQYSDQIHTFPKVDECAKTYKIRDTECAIIHFNYITVEQWVSKLNSYTTKEAEYFYKNGDHFKYSKLMYTLTREVGLRFLLSAGWRNGFQGLAICFLMIAYQVTAYLKLYLMDKFGTLHIGEPVAQKYQEIASECIRQYEND